MNYQVCWKYETDAPVDPWHAQFFFLKETAVELFKVHKSLGHETKLLTIEDKNNVRNS